jgi:phosphatidylglycerol---prolipoprotein diacylglyceryl transferase
VHPFLLGTRAYPLFLALAVAAGVAMSVRGARRARIPLLRWLAFQLVLAAAGLLGAKLFHVWEQGAFATFDLSRLLTADGFRYPGGLLAALLVLPLARPIAGAALPVIADAVAPAAAVAMAVVRVGCFLQGCCFGTTTSLPWGIRFPMYSPAWDAHLEQGWIALGSATSLAVHPLQIYFGLWSAIVAATLLVVEPRKQYAGQLFLLFLVLHEGGKAALETLRVPFRPSLQLASLAVALAAAACLVALSLPRRAARAS